MKIIACFAFLLCLAVPARAITFDPDASGDDLPLNVNDERSLLALARAIPAVRSGMEKFQALGYVPTPAYDKAIVVSPGQEVVALLFYDRPGYRQAPGTLSCPAIMVGTILRSDGVPITRAGAGIVVFDQSTGAWHVEGPNEDAVGDRYIILSDEQMQVLKAYAVCAGTRNGYCVASGLIAGASNAPAGVALGLVCVIHETTGCLSRAINSWPK